MNVSVPAGGTVARAPGRLPTAGLPPDRLPGSFRRAGAAPVLNRSLSLP